MAGMSTLAGSLPRPARISFHSVLWPKEHGSWSLALEPIVLGLLIAPSWSGAWFGLAAFAVFLARRPLRAGVAETKPDRRTAAWQALAACAAVAFCAAVIAFRSARAETFGWLMPSVVGGAVFLAFDLRRDGREQIAEVAGAFAFACLTAVLVSLGNRPGVVAAAAGAVMLARSVPTVLVVREFLRERKSRSASSPLALFLALAAAAVVAALHRRGEAPLVAVGLGGLLAARAAVLFFARPAVRASTLGMFEVVLGIVFVVGCGLAWPN